MSETESSSLLRRAAFEARVRLDLYPGLLRVQMAMRGRAALVVSEQTDIVIEGFPRSGNTYAVAAFVLGQPRPLRIARHLHAPAHLLLAQRYGVPALLVVRPVPDPVLSLVIRESYLTVVRALRWYVDYHEALLPHRASFECAGFDEVLGNYAAVIERLNARYGREFARPEQNKAAVQARIEQMEREDSGESAVRETYVARPSPLRDRLKDELRPQYDAPALAGLRRAAEQLYAEFVAAPGLDLWSCE